MKKQIKNKSGITLIALIITIIVMLILVGVTVNVALNGGLFNVAENAAKKTEIETDRETLYSAVKATQVADKDLKIKKAQNLEDNLPEDWNATGNDGGPYTCTSPRGNVFTVTADGIIKYIEDENQSGGEQGGNNQKPELASDWYIPTDDEIAEFVAAGVYYEEEGGFAILGIEGQPVIYVMKFTFGEDNAATDMYLITIEDQIDTTGGFVYASPEFGKKLEDGTTAAEALGLIDLDVGKWIYCSTLSHFEEGGIEYNGEFPYNDENIAQSTVYSQTYLNRIKASFKGEEEQIPNSLEEFSLTEMRCLNGHDGYVADGDNSKMRVLEGIIRISHLEEADSTNDYIYCFTDEVASGSGIKDSQGAAIQGQKWYKHMGYYNTELYEGESPVSAEDFNQIYCRSYLDRVIASFNN